MKKVFLGALFLFTQAVFALPAESLFKIGNNAFSYFSSVPLENPTTEITNKIHKLILVVHGSERNAHTYYNSIEAMAKKNNAIESTLIISPHFKEANDIRQENELYFSSEGWLRSDSAINQKLMTSFEVLEELINKVVHTFPNLKEVVLTGHSAGGQLTQRFALGSKIDTYYPKIQFRFIVANPGSYAYLNPKRINSKGDIGLPTTSCAYDNYKYGLKKLNPYMQKRINAETTVSYAKKEVIYFLGEKDNVSDGIDQSCEAQFQGATRLERGQRFKYFMNLEYPNNIHEIITVKDVGHTQYGMYTSEIGQKLLFSP